ncbi:hypothetical protein [Halioglobus sp. HI00S01]|uniref:hypothetical protein n=1 Tax=Halioglobus sp. HI00S01 TaxID=1822214 RepID=UPI0012E846F6|nr:hypothetical protein [Halioglobus sp. HI00S01]
MSLIERVARDCESSAKIEGVPLERAIEDWEGDIEANRYTLSLSEQNYMKSLICGDRFDLRRISGPVSH